jgi:hypothetical protein
MIRHTLFFWSVVAITCVTEIPVAGQSPVAAKPPASSKSEPNWTPPRTADGHPDLQSTWTNATNKPLERPKELGAKEFYTEQEFAEVSKKGFLGERNAQPEAHYDFSQFGMDAMQAKFAPNLRTSLIVGPEGRIPPMTPEGMKRNAERAAAAKGHEFDSAQNRGLMERCIVYGQQEGPPMLPPMYNNNMEIVQGPGYVAILNEMYHDTRNIPTDGSAHLPASIRQWRGDSRGRWEGDTLVVDTTNFTDKTPFHGSSEFLHVVERFTRTGPATILYQFTVDDPHTWAKPWSAELTMGPADGDLYEFACHEGNYGLANNLSGARAEEKRAQDQAKEAKSAK